MTEWLLACSIHGQIQFRIKGVDVFLEPIHLPEGELFDVGKRSGDQNKQETHKEESMAIFLATFRRKMRDNRRVNSGARAGGWSQNVQFARWYSGK